MAGRADGGVDGAEWSGRFTRPMRLWPQTGGGVRGGRRCGSCVGGVGLPEDRGPSKPPCHIPWPLRIMSPLCCPCAEGPCRQKVLLTVLLTVLQRYSVWYSVWYSGAPCGAPAVLPGVLPRCSALPRLLPLSGRGCRPRPARAAARPPHLLRPAPASRPLKLVSDPAPSHRL